MCYTEYYIFNAFVVRRRSAQPRAGEAVGRSYEHRVWIRYKHTDCHCTGRASSGRFGAGRLSAGRRKRGGSCPCSAGSPHRRAAAAGSGPCGRENRSRHLGHLPPHAHLESNARRAGGTLCRRCAAGRYHPGFRPGRPPRPHRRGAPPSGRRASLFRNHLHRQRPGGLSLLGYDAARHPGGDHAHCGQSRPAHLPGQH